MARIAIIGGGPAGLRAAEIAMGGGAEVTVFEAKPSVGRKFLVAGRGGLNLTKAEPRALFQTRYPEPERWEKLLAACDGEGMREWAASLGVETFAASTGRVYPREMKAAPLLRRWVQRLREGGVHFATRHRWIGLQPGPPWQLHFQVAEEENRTVEADAVILALGGGSWPETGSDGRWTEIMEKLGVPVAPLQPANCGWECDWNPETRAQAGQPLKNVVVQAAGQTATGELMLTDYGLEGGALYALGAALRGMAAPQVVVDLKPLQTVDQLARKVPAQSLDWTAVARQNWRLSPAAWAVVAPHLSRIESAADLAALVKACPINLRGPRPLAEAISTAGGLRWEALDEHLMIRQFPGIFAAGEMIDWEAPTGGYLLTGCFATGTRAAHSALHWLAGAKSAP